MPKASFLAEENPIPPVAAALPVATVVDVNSIPPSTYAVVLPVSEIALDPVTNVRSGDESAQSIQEFAARIQSEGLAQPILVRPNANGQPGYRVIAGRRRLLAVQSLGGSGTIAAYVRDVDDETARRLAFEENYRRKQFSPIDLAKLFLEARAYEMGPGASLSTPRSNWSERVAKKFNVSRATVTEHVKMIEGIADDPKLIAQVHAGELALDAAILLAKTRGEERSKQLEQAKTIAEQEDERKRERARVDARYAASKKAAKKNAGKAGKPGSTPAAAPEAPDTQESHLAPATEPAAAKKPAKVQAKHLRQAQSQAVATSGGSLGRTMTRSEVLDNLCSLRDTGYPKCMNDFLEFLCGAYQSGKGSQAELVQRWRAIASVVNDELTGIPPAAKQGKPAKKAAVKSLKQARASAAKKALPTKKPVPAVKKTGKPKKK